MARQALIWFYVTIIIFQNCSCHVDVSDIKDTVVELFNKIKDLQVKVDSPESIPPIKWAKFKGVYESDVKFNFHGNPSMTALRYMFSVYDNNMFATTWVTSVLLEAYKYGKAPKPSDEQIEWSVDAISDHNNKNLNYTNSIMAFWPQLYNENVQYWQSTPINLLSMFNETAFINWTAIYPAMEKLGLGDVVKIMQNLLGRRDGYRHVFQIPPDFDDTSVNLGMGSLIRDMALEFPQSNAKWQIKHSNLSSVFSALKYYAYKPMSNESRINTIDTRTYFYMRKFLEWAKSEGRDVALTATWVQDLIDIRTEYYKGVDIPGSMNNVDITVSANVLYGITNAILSGLVTAEVLEDKEIQQIYLNTSTMIAFQINTNFSSRPDLALTYYPSEFEFYWFVARTYSQLKRRESMEGLPHWAMRSVLEELKDVLKGNMTTRTLNKNPQSEGPDMIFYDDFLGDGDYSENGNPVAFGEDRLFTTAMAANALITTWSIYEDSVGALKWDPETPEAVKSTVTKLVTWLNKYILSGAYKPWNAFFSGSAKGTATSQAEYPENRYEYINGTKVPDGQHHHYAPSYRGMQGVVNETWYQQQIVAKKSPVDFHGFNNNDYFPFWCSESYTYAVTMLALSTFTNILN